MRSALERRHEIIQILNKRRFETIENLTKEFNVSDRTIRRDIGYLMSIYPIYTTQGTGGGINVVDGWQFGMKYLTDKQVELLKRLAENLTGADLKTMQYILKTFSTPKKEQGG